MSEHEQHHMTAVDMACAEHLSLGNHCEKCRHLIIEGDAVATLLVAVACAHQPPKHACGFTALVGWLAGRRPGHCLICRRLWPCDTYRIAMHRLAKGPDDTEGKL
jgi:hypothetical protein